MFRSITHLALGTLFILVAEAAQATTIYSEADLGDFSTVTELADTTTHLGVLPMDEIIIRGSIQGACDNDGNCGAPYPGADPTDILTFTVGPGQVIFNGSLETTGPTTFNGFGPLQVIDAFCPEAVVLGMGGCDAHTSVTPLGELTTQPGIIAGPGTYYFGIAGFLDPMVFPADTQIAFDWEVRFNVIDPTLAPAPVPLPAGMVFLTSALGFLVVSRRKA